MSAVGRLRTRAAALTVAAAVVGRAATALAAGAPSAAAPTGRAPFERTEERVPCADFAPLRRVFFGDLHVHTALSLDATTQGTRNRPRDAYRFARGERLGLQPYDAAGRPLRTARLGRPLDFVAVTDHSEYLGEVHTCAAPGAPGYGSAACRILRRWPRLAFFLLNGRSAESERPVRLGFCGSEPGACLRASATPWREIQEAAEEAYDRSSACSFTTFVAYEWTKNPGSKNLHRNVIFRNAAVPALPASVFEAPLARDLWAWLERECERGVPGCEAVVIPHNSNLSAGLMFQTKEEDGTPFTPQYARRRARHEPLVEVTQHKGDSECRTGVGTADELCSFEKLPYDSFGGKFAPFLREKPRPGSFVRNALIEGLALGRRLGANPFAFGLVGSTDTHLGTPGAVAERHHQGHGGAGPVRGAGLPDDPELNPGGLTALWAEENSRDSLFAAMRRREAYATSGPRITLRFFGGWALPEDICSRPNLAAEGYRLGVPMGGTLRPGEGGAPRFVVWAARDPGAPGEPGTPLERVQIVKGWVDEQGGHERVLDVAGRATPLSPGELETCSRLPAGADSLCSIWSDPDFDPGVPALYYARVLERPSCRWTTWACERAGVDCSQPEAIPPGFEPCCDAAVPRTIRERAWSSPIWYAPPARASAPRG